jgi:hypothetical protein
VQICRRHAHNRRILCANVPKGAFPKFHNTNSWVFRKPSTPLVPPISTFVAFNIAFWGCLTHLAFTFADFVILERTFFFSQARGESLTTRRFSPTRIMKKSTFRSAAQRNLPTKTTQTDCISFSQTESAGIYQQNVCILFCRKRVRREKMKRNATEKMDR